MSKREADFDDHPCAVMYGYHPEHLMYTLTEQPYDGPPHPREGDGPRDPAVGVHQMVNALSWETVREGQAYGYLGWHEVQLRDWTGTRSDFARAPLEEQRQALREGPSWARGKWGTHLGATMTVVTADGFTVFRSRRGKYAEEDSYDSLLAGTMLVSDVDGPDYSTDQYLRMLVAEARLDGDGVVTEFHPTHLAMRKADFGLWIGGWISVSLTAGEVKEAVPFDTVAVGMGSPVPMPLTPWGQFDLDAARTHLDGRHLRQALWLP